MKKLVLMILLPLMTYSKSPLGDITSENMPAGARVLYNPYITDGLVSMWDGEYASICNEIRHKKGCIINIINGNTTSNVQFSAFGTNWFSVASDVSINDISKYFFPSASNLTIEVSDSLDEADFNIDFYKSSLGGNMSSASICVNNANNGEIGWVDNGGILYRPNLGAGGPDPNAVYFGGINYKSDKAHTLSVVRTETQVKYYFDGVPKKTTQNYNFGKLNDTSWIVGGNGIKHHCIRIYNRALMDAEIEFNCTVDKIRFKNENIPIPYRPYPPGVTPVEFIAVDSQSTLKRGILTGFIPTTQDKVEACFEVTAAPTAQQRFFFAGSSGRVDSYVDGSLQFAHGMSSDWKTASVKVANHLNKKIIITMDMSAKTSKVTNEDGSAISSVTHSSVAAITGPIQIFYGTPTVNDHYFKNGRFYWMKVYRSGVLRAYFVPVRITKPNGTTDGAVFDRINGELWNNISESPFSVGSDITP